MARRDILELAVLGSLHERPMHGYELRKQLNVLLGSFRALSYGTLYPALKELLRRGLITEEPPEDQAQAGRRSRIVYRLTPEGKDRLAELLSDAGPSAWDDEPFGVHLAFFGRTDASVRLRILEGRRSRLEERREAVRASLARTRERVDSYTLALQQHGLESVEREVRWLTELIETERAGTTSSAPLPAPTDEPGAAPTDEPRPARVGTDREGTRKSVDPPAARRASSGQPALPAPPAPAAPQRGVTPRQSASPAERPRKQTGQVLGPGIERTER